MDWTEDDGKKVVTGVVLGDFDLACKLHEGESRLTRHAIGNAMWRSPEAQTGVTGRASDVYSLGLVVSQACSCRRDGSNAFPSSATYLELESCYY